MSTDKPAEGFRSKLVLLLIDKALLGGFLILFAYWLNANLQREGQGIDYQKIIFDRRVEAYLDVLQKAQRVTDQLDLYWAAQRGTESSARLSDIETRWQRLVDRAAGGGGSSWSNLNDVLPALRDLESSWGARSIYFTPPASAAVDEFLTTVYADLDKDLAVFEDDENPAEAVEQNPQPDIRDASWLRAREAFQKLRSEIQTRLKLNGVFLDLG